jgi:hypothetical protein
MKPFVAGFLTCLLLVAAILVPYLWPPELSLLFNSLFWSAAMLFLLSSAMVGYLYATHGGSSRGTRFYFGLCLVIAASFMFSGFEHIAQNTVKWAPLMQKDYPSLLVLLSEFVSYTKNIVSFGIAALGANVAANAIVE